MSQSRRTFLAAAGSAGAALMLTEWAQVEEALAHAAQAVRQVPRPNFTILSATDAATLEAVAERILPATETPGATDLGVIHFADRAFGTFFK